MKILSALFNLIRFLVGMSGIVLMICETPDEAMQFKVILTGLLLLITAIASGIIPIAVDVALYGISIEEGNDVNY